MSELIKIKDGQTEWYAPRATVLAYCDANFETTYRNDDGSYRHYKMPRPPATSRLTPGTIRTRFFAIPSRPYPCRQATRNLSRNPRSTGGRLWNTGQTMKFGSTESNSIRGGIGAMPAPRFGTRVAPSGLSKTGRFTHEGKNHGSSQDQSTHRNGGVPRGPRAGRPAALPGPAHLPHCARPR